MRITLLDMLKNAGLITREQFEEALRNRVVFGGKIGTSLIELGFVCEEDLAKFLSSKLAVPYVPPERLLAIPAEIIALIPRDLALKFRAIPIHRDQDRLFAVMSDPADLKAVEELSGRTGFAVTPLVTPEVRLIQALGKYYQFHIDRRFQQIIERIERQDEVVAAGEGVLPPLAAEEGLEEAELVNDEEWVARVGRYSIDDLSASLARADDREEIAGLLMGYLGQEFDRVALFFIRGATAFGWKCTSAGMELKDFDRIAIPLDDSSILKTIVDGKSYYLGAIPPTRANVLLLDAMGGGAPATALLLPLIIAGRVAGVLYVEGRKKELGEQVAVLHRLLSKAALAFEILVFREKILMT